VLASYANYLNRGQGFIQVVALAGSGTFEGIMLIPLTSKLTPGATLNGVGNIPRVSISINGVPVKPGCDVPSMVSEVVITKVPLVKSISNGPPAKEIKIDYIRTRPISI
jgi:hypothetical protein